MKILLVSQADSAESWGQGLRATNLPLPLEIWPDMAVPEEIRYAIAAKPPAGLLASLPNLRAILSLWAGVDHITSDPDWPQHIPIYRMIEPGLTGGMVEFVLSQVLNLHLNNYEITEAQRRKDWLREPRGAFGLEPLVGDRTVGVLGLGEMGRNSAEMLRRVGFKVIGWSRRQKTLDGIECLSGTDGLDTLLSCSDILVNLLPLTPETNGLLNADMLRKLPRGAGLINTGRGQHIVDADLIAVLDEGHLSRAVLDVFDTEPLPQDHPFWTHPRVTVYPHIASVTRVKTGVASLARSLELLESGETPAGYFDPDRGY
ncbi:MAG: glyoxylate/hydroxypyruvate reductase A [Alphaproteobacteria bacterium]|nr:glyoxylate/hydroxypyruvate reductase A [Alphaproteobacteria bacterium]